MWGKLRLALCEYSLKKNNFVTVNHSDYISTVLVGYGGIFPTFHIIYTAQIFSDSSQTTVIGILSSLYQNLGSTSV